MTICEAVGIEPDTAPCVAVAMGGWLVIVVTIGIVLKVGRLLLGTTTRTD